VRTAANDKSKSRETGGKFKERIMAKAAKSDGGKHLETLAQQLISGSAQPARTQSVTGSMVKALWRTNPTPPEFVSMITDCMVLLTGPISEEELDRTWCGIECQEPNSSTWRLVTDFNGQGTVFEPFNGAYICDEVTQSGTHLYRARATYSSGTPNEVISDSIEVEVEDCQGARASAAAKKPASKKAQSKS
jgi:hypothetical protein